MIDGSEKRNRQLAFELQNSHVCERPSIKPGTRNILEHAGTFRNIPEHEKIKVIFMKKIN